MIVYNKNIFKKNLHMYFNCMKRITYLNPTLKNENKLNLKIHMQERYR